MRKVASNFVYQLLYQISILILPIITIPVVSKALGPEGVGIWNYTQSIVNYFLLIAGLGLANYGIREIALVRDSKEELSQKFWELEVFNAVFSTCTLITYILFSLFLENTTMYLIQSLIVFSTLLDISWFFAGIEEFKKVTLRGILIKFTSFIFIVILVKTPSDLYVYALIQSLSIFFSQLLLWPFILKHICFKKVTVREAFKHFRPALNFFIAKIAMTIYMNLNKTILGAMTTMTIVGYYSQSLVLTIVAGSIVTAMNSVMIPVMSNLYGKNEIKKMNDVLAKVLHLQLFITIPISFGIILISEKMVTWFFGPAFYPMIKIIPLLAPVLIFQSLQSSIASQYLIPMNDMKSYNVTIIYGAVVSIIINLIFIPFIGVYGAVLATLCSQILICLTRCYVLIKKISFKFDFLEITKEILASLLMVIVVYLITKNLEATPLTTAIQIVLGFLFYLLLCIIIKSSQLRKIGSILLGRFQ